MSPRHLSAESRNRQGFTLVELLVVVLILAILMAVAMPLYLNAVADTQRKTCRANMQTISNAVAAARVKSNASNYGSFITGGVNTTTLPDLTAKPICPNGGTYTLDNGSTGDNTSFQVKCSYGTGTDAHGHYEPGVDSN